MEHELLHVLGFFHEHSRMDRYKYIRIIADNITPEDLEQNFKNYTAEEMNHLGTQYDYGSVLHYGATQGAK